MDGEETVDVCRGKIYGVLDGNDFKPVAPCTVAEGTAHDKLSGLSYFERGVEERCWSGYRRAAAPNLPGLHG
jgi:hypothetical protein